MKKLFSTYKYKECPNCSTFLHEEFHYCPKCGQENHHIKIPIWHVLYEFIESIFHFDTKLWNTIVASITAPGKVVKDFLNGKRARYVPPPRLYIFVSVIYFALLNFNFSHIDEEQAAVLSSIPSINKDKAQINSDLKEVNSWREPSIRFKDLVKDTSLFEKYKLTFVEDLFIHIPINKPYTNVVDSLQKLSESSLTKMVKNEEDESNSQVKNTYIEEVKNLKILFKNLQDTLPSESSITLQNFNIIAIRFKNTEELKTFYNLMDIKDINAIQKFMHEKIQRDFTPDSWTKRYSREQIYMADIKNKLTPNYTEKLLHAIVKGISLSMFLLMPFSALLLRLFFRRYYYAEHLVFSIHIHTIFFVLYSIRQLITMTGFFNSSVTSFSLLMYFSIVFYFFFALHKVYENSVVKTFFKMVAMSIPYFVILIACTLFATVYGFSNA